MTLRTEVDHLVVAAATLDEGVAWCRETLGFEPVAGGEHPLMGTHNRVFRIASQAFPRVYFEIIAINPAAKTPSHPRWFDLDSPQMREQVAQGPHLIHFVANSSDATRAVKALSELGIDRGPLVAAERATATGLLRWRISVRNDGARLHDGALPTLIEWSDSHPSDSLPESGIALRSIGVSHPDAAMLRHAYAAIGLQKVGATDGPANIEVLLDTPRGRVRLESKGI